VQNTPPSFGHQANHFLRNLFRGPNSPISADLWCARNLAGWRMISAGSCDAAALTSSGAILTWNDGQARKLNSEYMQIWPKIDFAFHGSWDARVGCESLMGILPTRQTHPEFACLDHIFECVFPILELQCN